MMLGRIKNTIITVVLTILLTVLVYIFFKTFNLNPFARPGIKIDSSSASVVKEIQALSRLETVVYTIEKIVEAGQQGNAFQNLLYGDRILLIAHGKVTAGVDLSQVTKENISITGTQLTIDLPPPNIFSSSLDNTQTRVYDRRLGFLNRGNKDLESEARSAAETLIYQSACEAHILDEAGANAIERLQQLFQFLGFTSVIINIPQGNC